MQVTDLKAADNDNSSEETTEQSMEITAEVAGKTIRTNLYGNGSFRSFYGNIKLRSREQTGI